MLKKLMRFFRPLQIQENVAPGESLMFIGFVPGELVLLCMWWSYCYHHSTDAEFGGETNFGNGPNTVSESTVSNTEVSEFFGTH